MSLIGRNKISHHVQKKSLIPPKLERKAFLNLSLLKGVPKVNYFTIPHGEITAAGSSFLSFHKGEFLNYFGNLPSCTLNNSFAFMCYLARLN